MGRLTDTISGGIATFRTPGKQSIRHLKAYFTPKQEGTGTPSPENVRPIVLWDGVEVEQRGKNLLNPNASEYYGYTVGPDGASVTSTADRITSEYIPCMAGVTVSARGWKSHRPSSYTFSFAGIAFYDSDKAFISRVYVNNQDSVVGIAPARTAYMRYFEQFNNMANPSPALFATYERQLEFSALPTAYEVYRDNAHILPFSSEVYGGYVDLVTGEVWVNNGSIALSAISWRKDANRPGIFYGSVAGRINGSDVVACDTYNVRNLNISTTVDTYISGKNDYGGTYVFLRNTAFAELTAAEMKAAVTGNVVFQQTPTLVATLTPTALRTFLGTNNIWCNAGDVEVEYDFAESREMWEARKRVAGFDAAMRRGGGYFHPRGGSGRRGDTL